MILRVWVIVAAFAFACAGKSERSSSDSTAGNAEAAGYGAAATETGTGEASAAASGGGSAGTGGASNAASSGASAKGDDDLENSPECLALSAGSIVDSCNRLASCAATLSEYLDLLRARGKIDDAAATLGCNHISITVLSDVPTTELTFDQGGVLVGYSIAEDQNFGACAAYQYVRGAGLAGCKLRECSIDPAARDAGSLCSCPCPDPPPADGVALVSDACVTPSFAPAFCEATSEDEHQATSSLEAAQLHWGNECGFEVAYLYGDIRCYYGDDGALTGVRNEDAGQCPGVVELATEGVPPVCKL